MPCDADASMMSLSLMPPTPWWTTLTRTSGCWIFASSLTIASTEPCTSPLITRLRSRTSPAWSASNRFSSEMPAGRRRAIEAENLDRVAGACRRKLLALVVVEGAHLAPRIAGHDRVADAKRAALHEHRRDGAAADV